MPMSDSEVNACVTRPARPPLSDSGSEMEVTVRAQVLPDAVSMSACSFLASTDISHQVACTCASAVRDEEAASPPVGLEGMQPDGNRDGNDGGHQRSEAAVNGPILSHVVT
jgi:hypothetical protein